ncbi:MAG: hypothetical protein JW818_18435 [Pirellulales bacterium]|nr:hypothetical protein [Pirellulales bacterium]
MANRPNHLRTRSPRRGALSLAVVGALVVCLLLAAWVWNWNYLVLVNRDMTRKCDAIALAAAPALLDEDFLRGLSRDQNDDLADARAEADRYRRQNNAAGPRPLVVHEDDLRVASGYVADPTGTTEDVHFDPDASLTSQDQPHNTLLVWCERDRDGDHPVRPLVNVPGGGVNSNATIRRASMATLDNLVVGCRPTPSIPAPLAPLAVSHDAWENEQGTAGDTNGNGIGEMLLRLKSPDDQAAPPNTVLIDYNQTDPVGFDTLALAEVIVRGVFPDRMLGGRLEVVPWLDTWRAALRQVDASIHSTLTLDLAKWINDEVDAAQAAGKEFRRAFPLYTTFAGAGGSGQANLKRLVACRVLGADVVDDRLVVRVEPCFLIHTTLWTDAPVTTDGHAVERNPYLHKLRLTR